jgi:hypothetical protein
LGLTKPGHRILKQVTSADLAMMFGLEASVSLQALLTSIKVDGKTLVGGALANALSWGDLKAQMSLLVRLAKSCLTCRCYEDCYEATVDLIMSPRNLKAL